jgi:hypothetical protein
MIVTIQSNPKPRRRFRFGLRTLLVVVTLSAVGSWAYWIGWPWWQIRREQLRPEGFVRRIHVGMSYDDIFKPPGLPSGTNGSSFTLHGRRQFIVWLQYSWPNSMYVFCVRFPIKGPGLDLGPCDGVELFALAPPPPNYHIRSENGGEYIEPLGEESARFLFDNPYIYDFLDFVLGDDKNNPGFEYELIYSDPSAKPVAK